MNNLTILMVALLSLVSITIAPMDPQLSKQREELSLELKQALRDVSECFQKYPCNDDISDEKKREIRDQIYVSVLQAYNVEATILGACGIN